ncbi:MAG: aminotransferase class III-fold pyridoxal phosphate-dependent enzyme [Gemmatimonadetes bacterium]|nr:aminotransferase class III-fold pyridoxal phosphate-dependent enzyme [Gemmatimonadota bacterium]
MTSPHIPGGTSTGSKRPSAFLGTMDPGSFPGTMVKARGARVWDTAGRDYLDYVMGLGAVTLGYAHPEVVRAAQAAVADGVVGPVAPVAEDELAGVLVESIPGIEQVRFLKTGAEAVAAAVRIARVVTGRERVVTCGYHGWLDWCQTAPGVPRAVTALALSIPFNDREAARRAIGEGEPPAAVVIEPVIDGPPDPGWLALLRDECSATGTVLVFDEIKTAFRLAPGGAAERFGVTPDLIVLGKGLANGFPLAVVGGRRAVMEALTRTWISSTLATENVSLRAALATVSVSRRDDVPGHLTRVGTRLFEGLTALCGRFQALGAAVRGVPQMCYLTFADAGTGWHLTRLMAERGIIWKPTAYNFVSLAHTEDDVDRTLTALEETLSEIDRPARG